MGVALLAPGERAARERVQNSYGNREVGHGIRAFDRDDGTADDHAEDRDAECDPDDLAECEYGKEDDRDCYLPVHGFSWATRGLWCVFCPLKRQDFSPRRGKDGHAFAKYERVFIS